MKFENLYIKCQNLKERDAVINKALGLGYTRFCEDLSDTNVVLTECGKVFDLNWWNADDNKAYIKTTYSEFMESHKEVTLIEKIHQAKKELGLNNSELSLRMGKSRPYIAKMLNQPQSEKVQNKVIAELDKLLNKSDVDDTFVSNLADELESKDKEISDLKKVIESKDLAISGLIKQNDKAKEIHDKDVKALADKDDQILLLKETNQHAADEVYCFVNKCGQYKSDVASLKSKIKRERIIILIVIAILTALFFLKGSIGG
uniref:Transcriptional regulator n=2 Tax=unclassified bacterial viruses TaxID=12333 RepID=A0AAU8KXT5_9VIRU